MQTQWILRISNPALLMVDSATLGRLTGKLCLRMASKLFPLGFIPGQYTTMCSFALVVAKESNAKPFPRIFS